MNRIRYSTRSTVFFVALSAFLAIAVVAPLHASDNDGISGYSIRLKNKNFDGSDGSGSGSSFSVGSEDEARTETTLPRASRESTVLEVLSSSLGLYFERWFFFWLR